GRTGARCGGVAGVARDELASAARDQLAAIAAFPSVGTPADQARRNSLSTRVALLLRTGHCVSSRVVGRASSDALGWHANWSRVCSGKELGKERWRTATTADLRGAARTT